MGDRTAICHLPSMDMGGKARPGVPVVMKPALDRKGQPVGPDAVSAKYGTPKCEFIGQLIHCLERDNEAIGGCYIGAHPTLGEELAEALVSKGLLGLPDAVVSYQREVKDIAGVGSRADFVLEHESGRRSVLEVKTVVDTDSSPSTEQPVSNPKKSIFISSESPYKRAAIFPWGRAAQNGPDKEKVVSARAIKHLDELAALASRKRLDEDGKELDATVLFIVTRSDAVAFRPNHEACPSFARHLKRAEAAGVRVLVRRITWGEGESVGKAFDGGSLPLVWLPGVGEEEEISDQSLNGDEEGK